MNRLGLRHWLVAGCCFFANFTMGHDLELDFITGLDSNPNKVTSNLDQDNGAFWRGRFEFSHLPIYSGYYYEVEAYNDMYKTGEETTLEGNSEYFRGKAELGFKWRPEMQYGRARLKWEVDYNIKDSVFVDRSTGDVATTNDGELIGERFDATWAGFKAKGKVPISEQAHFLYELEWKDKEYESYQDLGLSNLSYEQAETEIGFEKEIWSDVLLKTTIGYGRRFYVDRRARDTTGDRIPETDLEYTFIEAENELEYQISRRWKWQLGLEAYQRQDNEEGYFDSTTGQFYTRVRYRNGDIVKFLFKASYLHREYDQIEEPDDETIIPDPGLDPEADPEAFEDVKEREGLRVKAEFVRRLVSNGIFTLDLIMGLRYDSFENSNPIFAYDRAQTYAGIRWQPY